MWCPLFGRQRQCAPVPFSGWPRPGPDAGVCFRSLVIVPAGFAAPAVVRTATGTGEKELKYPHRMLVGQQLLGQQ